MLEPVFIKGHLNFKLEQQDFEFIHQSISIFGVTGLPWGRLNPKTHFGREVTVTIRIPGPKPLTLNTRAFIMREYTNVGEHMGLKFLMNEPDRTQLSALIQASGFYPTEYLRKYPRIPADPMIQTFPLRVLVLPETATPGQPPIIMDVSNLSPNGMLLHTENQQALSILSGQRLNLTLEPRGWFPMPIRVQGLVCRVTDELQPQNGNLIRYLGIKFARVDDVNRTAFLDLLKDILSRLKSQSPQKK